MRNVAALDERYSLLTVIETGHVSGIRSTGGLCHQELLLQENLGESQSLHERGQRRKKKRAVSQPWLRTRPLPSQRHGHDQRKLHVRGVMQLHVGKLVPHTQTAAHVNNRFIAFVRREEIFQAVARTMPSGSSPKGGPCTTPDAHYGYLPVRHIADITAQLCGQVIQTSAITLCPGRPKSETNAPE